MNFKHICGQDNMVPNTLSHYPDLANVTVVLESLLDRIQAVELAASRDLWEILVAHIKAADRVFTISDKLLW